MGKKLSVVLVLASGAGLFSSVALAGCSEDKLTNAETNLNNVVVEALNENDFIRNQTDAKFDSFQYLFSQALSDRSVELSGLAKYNTSSQGYISLQYSTGDTLNLGNDQASLLNALAGAIQTGEINKFTLTEVQDVKKLDDSVAKIVDSSVDGYNFNKGQVLSVKDIQFNDEDKQVSFNLIGSAEYLKTEQTVIMTPIYNGNMLMIIPIPYNKSYYKTIVSDNSVTITAESELYEEMKYDSSLVLDTFIEYTANKQTDKYYVKENASTEMEREESEKADEAVVDSEKGL